MKVLNIFRSEPDAVVTQLSESVSSGEEAASVALYKDNVDWSQLVDDIFSHDKVVSWW